MSARILKGAEVAAALNEKTAGMAAALKEKGISPCLAIVRVGEKSDDMAYERGILKRCALVGVEVRQSLLPESVDDNELITELCKLNKDESVHGILVFMPLPPHLDEKKVREAIDPQKDVDGVTEGSAAGVYSGSGRGFAPCTARACIEILRHYGIPMEGKRATVFGRSLVIGRPVAMLLMAENATVTICHSRSERAETVSKDSDIVVAALGRARALSAEYFRPGQVVVDVGINFDAEGKMCGDVDFEPVSGIVSAVTPVPGGVGAVTTAVLVRHCVEAAEKMSDKH